MNCAACKYEFCWTCLQHYKGYKHDAGTEINCAARKGITATIYAIFITLFFLIKLLLITSKDTSIFDQEPILDRLNAGESLLNKQNFLMTICMFIIINGYAFGTFVMCVITGESIRHVIVVPIILAEIVAAILFAFSNPWMQYGA